MKESRFLWVAIWLSLTLTSALTGSDAAPTRPAPSRLRVALLPFENATGNTAWDDWEQVLQSNLGWWLEQNSELFDVRDRKQARAALGRLGWTAGRPVDAELAEQAATELKADVVVWGSLVRQTNGWVARAWVLRPGGEAGPAEVDAGSPGWAGLEESLAVRLMEHLGRPMKEADRQRWHRYFPSSEKAAVCHTRAGVLGIREAPVSDREKALREVLALDPHCGAALWSLCHLLERAERWAEAETTARELVREVPDDCNSHSVLAEVLWCKDDKREAERELREMLRLHPGCPTAVWYFSRWLLGEPWKGLRPLLDEVHAARPDDLRISILLALARAQAGDTEGARDLLKEVRELPEEDEPVDFALLGAALFTGDFELAGRELLRLGPQASESEDVRDVLASLSLKLAPRGTDSKEPPVGPARVYSSAELKAELERRLSAEEQALVVNPIEITPEITAEARRLTVGLTNQAARALALYSQVARQGRGPGEPGGLTASQTLEAASDPRTRFSCYESAQLFVALARSVGLEAWLVHHDRLGHSDLGYHGGAALLLEGQQVLVDPAWRIFGVPDDSCTVLDDAQAISHQALQFADSKPDPRRLRLGLKLNPDDRWSRLQFVRGMAAAGEPRVAAEELARVRATGAAGWEVEEAAAEVDMTQEHWKPALAALQRALELNPTNDLVHVRLAQVYGALEDPVKAKAHLDSAVRLNRGEIPPKYLFQVAPAIAKLQTFTLARSKDQGDRQTLERRAGAGDPAAQLALAKLCFEARPPRTDEGMDWLLKAANQDDPEAQWNYARNLLALRGKEAGTEAVNWLTRAANQGDEESQYLLGKILYEGQLVPRDQVAACQWILVAVGQGHAEARRLLKEMELFLKADELAEARRRAQDWKSMPKKTAPAKTD